LEYLRLMTRLNHLSYLPSFSLSTVLTGLLFSAPMLCAEPILKWAVQGDAAWNEAGVWKTEAGEESSWTPGASAIFSDLKTPELVVDVSVPTVATSVLVHKNPLAFAGVGPLILKFDPTQKGHALRSADNITFDVPIQIDGGGSQSWMTDSKKFQITINKGISEITPTGISFAFGNLVLNSPSTFTGGITLNSAILTLANDAGAGLGPISWGDKSILAAQGGDRVIRNSLVTPYLNNEILWTFQGGGRLTIDAAVLLHGTDKAVVAMSIEEGMTVIFKQGICLPENRTAVPGLKLAGGNGTLVLQGEMASTGPLIIESGRLEWNASSEGLKSAVLGEKGVLYGNGTIGLADANGDSGTLEATGTLSPGQDQGVGKLSVTGNLQIGSGFRYRWNFGSRPREGDSIELVGSFSFKGDSGSWVFLVSPATGATLPSGVHKFQIASGSVDKGITDRAVVEIDPVLPKDRYSAALQAEPGGLFLTLTVK
jgi:hypothetical protein